MPATPDNPEGYFEHVDVVAHHERILHALGRRWDDLRPLPPRWWLQPAVTRLEDELRGLIEREFASVPLWAVKDPRMCRLLPAWRAPLHALGIEPCFVLVARDPREVAASLAARDGFASAKSHLLYLDHLVAAERATRGRPRAFVTYDELLADGAVALDRLGAELGLAWSARVRAEAARLAAFLRPPLRHHDGQGDGGAVEAGAVQPGLLRRLHGGGRGRAGATARGVATRGRAPSGHRDAVDAGHDGGRGGTRGGRRARPPRIAALGRGAGA